MSSEMVIGGPTHRQVFPIEETDREVSMSGILELPLFYKLKYMYEGPGLDFIFSDGDYVWEVVIADFQGRQDGTSVRATYSLTLGVTKLIRKPKPPVFVVPDGPPLLQWPELSSIVPDGATTEFFTAGGKKYVSGHVAVMWNGKFLEPGTEFIETTARQSVQIVSGFPGLDIFNNPDSVMLWYERGATTQLVWPTVSPSAVDGFNQNFFAPSGHKFYTGRVMVLLNGLVMVPGVQYNENLDLQSVNIFNPVPSGTDRVMLMYLRDLNNGALPQNIMAGNIIWPTQSPTAPLPPNREFALPPVMAQKPGRILAIRSGLALVPNYGFLELPTLTSTRIVSGTPPDIGESIMYMFEPY